MTRYEAVYRRAFHNVLVGKPLTDPQKREVNLRRLPDGSLPVPRHLDPTIRDEGALQR